MRHIIRGNPTPPERVAAETALRLHQQKYGDYARSKYNGIYRIRVEDHIYSVEIKNRKASYVATVMDYHRSLSKICNGIIRRTI